jgi:hypothetical protein
MKDQLTETRTGHVGTAALGCPGERSSTGLARNSIRLLAEKLKPSAQIFLAALREIFDESAYARFLNQRQLAPSRAAYACFRREYEVTKARRLKCC